MAEREKNTAVGAGTDAGNAREQERGVPSRAAEAEDDDNMESLRTTGARLSGAPGAVVGQTEQPEKAAAAPPDASGKPGREESVHPEQPRQDLEHNQAGIGSRMDRVKGRC